jgi:hypothetical protein
MRMLLAALFTFALSPLSAQSAYAQSEAQDRAEAYAAELIADAEAADLFEILDSQEVAQVRHRASGLVCRFSPGRNNQLHVFQSLARGEDVACDSSAVGEAQTIYATRYPQPTTLADQLDGAVAAMRARMRGLQPMPAESAVDIVPDAGALPDQASARFTYPGRNGIARYTRVSVAIVDDWVIKLRYTADAPDQSSLTQQDLVASVLWLTTLNRLSQAPKT